MTAQLGFGEDSSEPLWQGCTRMSPVCLDIRNPPVCLEWFSEIWSFTQLQRKGRGKTENTNSIPRRRLHWLEQHLIWFNYSHSPLSGGAPLPQELVLLLSLVTGRQALHQPLPRLRALKSKRTRWNFNDVLILMGKPFQRRTVVAPVCSLLHLSKACQHWKRVIVSCRFVLTLCSYCEQSKQHYTQSVCPPRCWGGKRQIQ